MSTSYSFILTFSSICILLVSTEAQFLKTFWSQPEPEIIFNDSPKFRGIPHTKECRNRPEFGRLTTVEVVPCVGKDRCDLILGTKVILKVDFVPNARVETLKGHLGGNLVSWLPTFPFGAVEDMCKIPTIACPVEKGKSYHYETTIDILKEFPRRQLDVVVRIAGPDGDVGCALIPVEIKSPPKIEPQSTSVAPPQKSFFWF